MATSRWSSRWWCRISIDSRRCITRRRLRCRRHRFGQRLLSGRTRGPSRRLDRRAESTGRSGPPVPREWRPLVRRGGTGIGTSLGRHGSRLDLACGTSPRDVALGAVASVRRPGVRINGVDRAAIGVASTELAIGRSSFVDTSASHHFDHLAVIDTCFVDGICRAVGRVDHGHRPRSTSSIRSPDRVRANRSATRRHVVRRPHGDPPGRLGPFSVRRARGAKCVATPGRRRPRREHIDSPLGRSATIGPDDSDLRHPRRRRHAGGHRIGTTGRPIVPEATRGSIGRPRIHHTFDRRDPARTLDRGIARLESTRTEVGFPRITSITTDTSTSAR